MTRCYAACRLLEHGPLTKREFVEITGWSPFVANSRLHDLCKRGAVCRMAIRGTHCYVYELAK